MKVKAMRGNVSIVVVNGERHVLLLARIDSAGFLTAGYALGKAVAAAAYRRSSAEIQNRLRIGRFSSPAFSTLLMAGCLRGWVVCQC